ncbi:MAG: type II toxin-antitoxin system VapC family toxin [Saprospiraceae bacterium]|nr:type II toxin-antitoxin system VapC family toxin [Saprospiraceae bacterium]
MGWNASTKEEANEYKKFVYDAEIFWLTEEIVEKTIEIRRLKRIKLPDAIIASTAIMHDLTLLTNNTGDFTQIPGLNFVNPMV